MFFLSLSLLVIVPGVISLVLPGGLNPGIDFTSGSFFTVRFQQTVEQDQLRQAFADLHHEEAIVQRSSDGTFVIRTFPLSGEIRNELGDLLQGSERGRLEQSLRERFGPMEVLTFDSVSPLVAAEVVQNSILAVAVACAGILLYLSFAFRHVPHPWRYGACAVFALVHDVLVLLGVFSILGRLFNYQLDALFITATLTVIGFSVHDTIVVFDRVRENLLRYPGEAFDTIMNHALLQTLGRSLSTSVTIMLVLLTLFLFGGVTVRPFVLALLVGVVSGTYSSIFNASMLLVVWEHGAIGRLFGRTPDAETAVEPRRSVRAST
jgi:preprotein translocase subunit SecF